MDGVIPFGHAVRVGSYKLWRGKYVVGGGEMSCLHVSDADGSWMVRIPDTSSMYGTIVEGYSSVAVREKFLGMLFTNMHNVCTMNSEALHDAFFFLQEMFRFPYLLLSEREMRKRLTSRLRSSGMDSRRVREHVGRLVSWRRELYELLEKKKSRFLSDYERHLSSVASCSDDDDDEVRRSALAEEAMEILSE